MAETDTEMRKERLGAYLGTVDRMEPDIAMVDRDAALASIAISLKRIADALDGPEAERRTNLLAIAIEGAIWRGMGNRG